MRRICAAAVVAGMTILLTLSAWKNHTYPSKTEVEPEYVFSYAENQPEDYPTTLGAKYFAELVEERTNGRIRILVQPVGVLGSENKVIKQMQYGGIDFTRVSLAQLAEYIPSLNVLQMPYLYTDSDHMWRVLDGEIGDAFLESVSADDVIGLSWYDAGARNFYNSVKPVTCLEDLKGMRIRVQESDLAVDMVEALGATAIPIAYGDVYASLERQVVDGAENNWPSYEAMRHYEVAKYYTVDEHSRVPEMQICSAYTWQKLSPEDREIILECARESAIYEREVWTQREEQSRSLPGMEADSRTPLRRVASRALRAATRAAWAAWPLAMMALASAGWASNQSPSLSVITRCTKVLASELPSLVLVWPSNCGLVSLTEITAVRPSRTSSPERFSSLSLRMPLSRA